MSQNKPNLIETLNNTLSKFSMQAGIFLALSFGVITAIREFQDESRHQTALLSALQSNVSLLAQNSDNREIERVLHSFLKAVPDSSVLLVKSGIVQVSLPDMGKTFLPYDAPKTAPLLGTKIGFDGSLYSSLPLRDALSHYSFGDLILRTPISSVIGEALATFLLSFFAIWILAYTWRLMSKKILLRALTPLKELHDDLGLVGAGFAPKKSPEDFQVKELSDMSTLIREQHQNVQMLTEVHAKAEGERLAKEGVRSLMHDLLNPYTAISNLVQARILYPDDEETAEALSTQYPVLNQQIKKLLKAARHMEVERLDLRTSDILETVRIGGKEGAAKNPEAVTFAAGHGPILVSHDSTLIARAVANLVRNSIEEGAKNVQVWCEESPLAIHIKDNGPGIPKEKIAPLFEGRLASSKPDGSGIGFPTALRLVQAHHGKITLQHSGTANQGAHFKIDLASLEKTL